MLCTQPYCHYQKQCLPKRQICDILFTDAARALKTQATINGIFFLYCSTFRPSCCTVLFIFSNFVRVHINRREVYSTITIRPSVYSKRSASPPAFCRRKGRDIFLHKRRVIKTHFNRASTMLSLKYFVGFHNFDAKSAKNIDFQASSVYSEHRKPNGFSHKAYETHKAKDITGGFML